jgi:hypothetical protein
LTRGPDGLAAQVRAVPDGSRATVRVILASDARLAFHRLSLVSTRGSSGAIPFWVGPDAVIREAAVPHQSAETAQVVKLPVAVNGRISAGGQLAYYAFDIAHEETVAFEVISVHGAGFDPQLALYESGGSYLDPRRSRRLLFHEEVTQGGMPAGRRLTYHFTKVGRYLVNLGNPFAQGGGDFAYLLRMAPAGRAAGGEDALAWARRRLRQLALRSVGGRTPRVVLVREAEPNDGPGQATRVFGVPAVLEGTIGRPGDIDRFRFRAKAGQDLAFEVQTPRAGPPHFNLRLDVLDATGAVVLTNLHVRDGKIGTVEAKVIQVAPDIVGRVPRDGEYVLRVRDLTSVQGSPDHVYWVLVRPQIPHVGDIQVQPGGPVNLRPGARQRLTVSGPGKEGYAGTLALSVEGLPPGVRAFVGARGSTVELVADVAAPVSPLPQVLRIWALPVVAEKSGSAFLAGEIPVMVVGR